MGIDKDPPYAYKDKTDNYDASLKCSKSKKMRFCFSKTFSLF